MKTLSELVTACQVFQRQHGVSPSRLYVSPYLEAFWVQRAFDEGQIVQMPEEYVPGKMNMHVGGVEWFMDPALTGESYRLEADAS